MEQLQRWDAAQKESIRQQIVLAGAKAAKEDNLSHAMSEAAIQKRKAREEKRAAEAAIAQAAAASEGSSSLFVPLPPIPRVPPRSETPSSQDLSYTVTVPAESSSLEWYDPGPHMYTTIAAAKAAGVWDYPSTLQERAKCGVFRGLWEQGYFMGGGIKFGADYLVYPGVFFLFLPYFVYFIDDFIRPSGDPLRYHSHFAASVIDSPLASLRPMEVVAHGRLGTATKKAHLLCGWDDEKQEVSYLSIEWAGFG